MIEGTKEVKKLYPDQCVLETQSAVSERNVAAQGK